MRIGLLAARAGISTSRIRFYEAEGLLPPPPRRHSGYRDYDERALEIILFINRARGLGFSRSAPGFAAGPHPKIEASLQHGGQDS